VSAIWLLSTRGRPVACQGVLDACEATGMSSPGVVYVDESVDLYRDLRLPENWSIHFEREWGSLQASLQWCLREYPDASQYGWLADDTYPRTEGWDKALEQAAGDWCLSYAKDLWLSEQTGSLAALKYGDDLSSGLCWGGELIRTVGWWALPGVRQAGIDTAWTAIISPLFLGRYVDDVTVEHKNYRTGKREEDSVDDWTRDGVDYIADDIAVRDRWVASKDYRDTLERVVSSARVNLNKTQMDRMRQKASDNYVNHFWAPSMPGVRLTNALERINSDLDELVRALLARHPHLVHSDPDLEQA